MIAYKYSFGKIESFEYENETDHFYVISKERRQAKTNAYEASFKTWQEAKDYGVNKAKENLRSKQQSLDYAVEHLKKIEALQP